MAQWKGLYTGNSHATKVRDLEAMLRQDIAKYREIQDVEDRARMTRKLQRIAKSLLSARLHEVEGRIAASPPKDSLETIRPLRERGNQLRASAAQDILVEFGLFEIE